MPHDVQYTGNMNTQREPHEPWCGVPHPFALAQCTCPASIDMGFSKDLNDLSYDQYDRLYDPMPMSDKKKEFIRQKLHGMDPRNPKYWPVSPDTGVPFDPLVGPPTLPGSAYSGVSSISIPRAVPLQAQTEDDESDETFEDEMEEDTPGTEAYIKKNQPAFWVVFQQREADRQRQLRGESLSPPPVLSPGTIDSLNPFDPDEGMSEAAVARKRRRQDAARHAQDIQAKLRANGLATQPIPPTQPAPLPEVQVPLPGHVRTGNGSIQTVSTVSGPAIPIPHTQVPCMEPLMYNPDPDNPDLKVMIECEVEENHTNAPHMKRLQGRKRGQDVFIGWWES